MEKDLGPARTYMRSILLGPYFRCGGLPLRRYNMQPINSAEGSTPTLWMPAAEVHARPD